jgi:hypothetical protein
MYRKLRRYTSLIWTSLQYGHFSSIIIIIFIIIFIWNPLANLSSTGKLLILIASSHLKTQQQKRIKAPSCMNSNALDVMAYVGKLIAWWKLDSSEIYNHITSCNEFNFVINLLELTPNDEVNNIKCSLTDLIFTNTKIIDKSNHWSLILYQESIAINRMKPFLNHGTKASKDLLIFN